MRSVKSKRYQPHPGTATIAVHGWRSAKYPPLRSASRRRNRGGNRLTLVALILLILIVMARRMMISAKPRYPVRAPAHSARTLSPDEQLVPAHKQALDQVTQKPSAH